MANVIRVWVDGKLNILADVGSRLSWEYDVVRSLPVPHKPILDIIRTFFRKPEEVKAEFAKDKTRVPFKPGGITGSGHANPSYRFKAEDLETGTGEPVEPDIPSSGTVPEQVSRPLSMIILCL